MGAHRFYKAATPYPSTALGGLDFVQNQDVVYFAHLDYPLHKLIRSDHTDWAFAEVTFGPTISPPTGHSVAVTNPIATGYQATTYRYVLTAISSGSIGQESRASTELTATNDLTLSGNFNTITLPAVTADIDRYVIYKAVNNGTFGYIGATDQTSFRDGTPAIQAVLSEAPPKADNPFAAAGDYPSALAFHNQRLLAARTRNVPNGLWGSQSGDYENMDRSQPTRPDDAFSMALVAERVNAINQIVSFDDLLALTTDGIWAIETGETGVLDQPKKQTGRGGARLKAIVIDTAVFFKPVKGAYIRTLGFSFEIDGYRSNNICLFSPHFFDGFTIVSWAYQEEPYSCIWAVRNDGVLLCFAWEEEQQVWGWSLCETDGIVERVAVISEGGFDRLYALIRRTFGGVERRFFERMALPHTDDVTTACHLDCAVTQVYDPPRNVVDGLWHLEGETVSAHYDGYSAHDLVVEDGAVSLPNDYEATIVTVGLRYTGRIQTLPPVLATKEGSFHSNRQQVDEIVVRTIDTKGIKIGATGTDLEQVQERDGAEVADLPDIDARDYEVPAVGVWADTSSVEIVQNEPFPAHIVSIFYSSKVSPK